MVLCNTEVFHQVSKLLEVTPDKLSCNSYSEAILLPKNSKTSICGFATTLAHIVSHSKSPLLPSNPEESALLHQWLEYCVCVLNYADSQQSALIDLNNIFTQKCYLIGNRCTVADAVVYYTIYPVMAGLSLQEKENLRHLSRWFSLIQSIPGIRDKHKVIVFSRNSLY